MNKRKIALVAPLSSYTGYGQYGRSVAQMLVHLYGESKQYQIMLFDINKYESYNKINLEQTRYETLVPFLKQDQNILQNELIDIFIMVSVPKAFIQKGLVNIGVTALSQADILHPSLIDYCNTMDEICVMSNFNVQTLKNSTYTSSERQLKIESDISILPYALKPVQMEQNYKTDISEFIDNVPQKFLFLNVGQWLPGSIGSDRKDIGSLIGIFLQGFANNKDIGLLLKTQRGNSTMLSQYAIRQQIRKIANMLQIQITHPNIHIISGNINQKQMVQLYTHQKIGAFTTFTHGQSCGIPLMQFAYYTGKPIVTPFHTGIRDYLKPQYLEILIDMKTPVPSQLLQTFFGQYATKESSWHTVDYQYSLFKMLDLIKGYNMFSEKSLGQKQNIESNYNVDVVSEKLRQIIQKYIRLED